MFELETKLGNIHFSQNIINKIVIDAVESCEGKAEILNYKGKYMNVVPGIASKINLYNEETGGIQIKEDEFGVEIQVYVIVHFGTSIKQVTSKIIDSVYENMEKIMGEKPTKVTVVVTGTLSRNIAKRHIEVSR
ncbi:MAG: Asp23/Gls24 family envelope stress response protein [Bacillota bacterium]|nr:Asp23/Gls24 family envelope stress response protein [Bacillota bacterium]